MSATLTIDEKKYAKLLATVRPVSPQNDEEEDRLTAELLRLEDKESLTREEEVLAEMLTVLLDEYGRRTVTFPDVSPADALRAMMQFRNLKQKDIVEAVGNKSLVSQILSGRKQMSKEVAKKIAAHFNGPVELFL